ncbi:hypothetical protein CY34DRAFT_812016 [Suillus luteus UH-Slu-Lm8-n1]|uniref:Uncharacterized protein n=1 Tax=Suillus luteus UH-Slu-Lm8-n1 TaxID=930992 RepID=A0A0D0AN10_9AGAM|nr:hypothetical protein CY34DRAFT_812016 [Suillus luteus UH-Slu-Lm8-n1]
MVTARFPIAHASVWVTLTQFQFQVLKSENWRKALAGCLRSSQDRQTASVADWLDLVSNRFLILDMVFTACGDSLECRAFTEGTKI